MLLIAATALSIAALNAQIVVEKGKKWDIATSAIIRNSQDARHIRTNIDNDTTASRFLITATDPAAVADSIAQMGGEVTVVGDNLLSAKLPHKQVEALAALESVSRIEHGRRFRPLLSTARGLVNVDSVHSGLGLETPYTGKGVVIGIIDQGFEFRHVAFLDSAGDSRVKALWNRTTNASKTTTIPSGSDGVTGVGGHATHVTGIAAGSVISGNNYYGMAPEADIVMIPSTFEESEVIEDVTWVKSLAEEQGSPWIVNMSFGSQIGPHDGSTTYDATLSNLCGSGGLIVGAMGNEGNDDIHASHTFTAAGETVYLALDNDPSYGYNYVDLWGNDTDGNSHLEITVMAYNASTLKLVEVSSSRLNQVGEVYGEINANNKKEHYSVYVSPSTLASVLGVSRSSNVYLVLQVKALDATASFHAWIESGYGEFVTVGGYGLAGDSQYLVAQGGASIPRAIGVGAFNGASSWIAAYNNSSYSYTSYRTTGQISAYSSPGPSLGSDMKPTVMAPGTTITSSLNRYDGPSSTGVLQLNDAYVVGAVNSSGEAVDYSSARVSTCDFYGVLSGTSMAAPAVSGILALWLQANPTLTPEQVVEIFKETAVHDTYTGGSTGDWTSTSGYGKIDAYAGLKKALELLPSSGIGMTMDRTQPVTLSKGQDKWRILFNVAESDVSISLYGMDGGLMERRALGKVVPGQESVIDLSTLAPGVYIINIVTPAVKMSRKVLVSR